MPDILVDKNKQSVEHSHSVSHHSHYDLRAILAGNYRFGEISPTYCERVVPDDKNATFQSGTDVRSLNLKSPLLQDVKLYKDYIQVPKSAILPLNWDKIEKMPNIGEDVVASNVNTTIENFIRLFNNWNHYYYEYLKACSIDDDSDSDVPAPWKVMSGRTASVFFRYLTWLKSLMSAGSLVSQLGTNLWCIFKNYDKSKFFDVAFDDLVDSFISAFKTDGSVYMNVTFKGSNKSYRVEPSFDDDVTGDDSYDTNVAISFRRFLELIRDEPNFGISFDKKDDSDVDVNITFAVDTNDIHPAVVGYKGDGDVTADLNIDSLAAYQLAIAHFFTNDKVDYVYSAELYRQNLRDAAAAIYGLDGDESGSYLTFELNGQVYLYDEFSAYKVKTILNTAFDYIDSYSESELDTAENYEIAALYYWNLIFSIRNSLRYMDYFVGAKTRPLGIVPNMSVPVVSGEVSMVNVAIGKAYTKLALASGRVGRKTEKYMREILHVEQHRDYHNPWFLAKTVDVLGSYDTENTNINPDTATSSDTQTTISNIRSTSNNYAFDIDIDCESIILCLMSFDIERIYTRTSTRFNRHIDRYDGFIPELQFIGDQKLYMNELDIAAGKTLNFGYRERNAEYKQSISRAFGAFALKGILPGWLMIANDRVNVSGQVGLSPSFIRSYPYEFDKFYISLLGKSDATYFHFIIKNTNYLSIDRPMIGLPSIF